jgi:hypothetical protein
MEGQQKEKLSGELNFDICPQKPPYWIRKLTCLVFKLIARVTKNGFQ